MSVPSLPSRGAWIEIARSAACSNPTASLPSRGAWIEIAGPPGELHPPASLPSRGAWIEMSALPSLGGAGLVAPLTGSVD